MICDKKLYCITDHRERLGNVRLTWPLSLGLVFHKQNHENSFLVCWSCDAIIRRAEEVERIVYTLLKSLRSISESGKAVPASK